MSQQLRNAFVAVLNAPYYKNEQAKSGTVHAGHEEALATIFCNNGFVKQTSSTVSKTILLEWANSGDSTVLTQVASSMPKGSFVVQPGGTQSFPDILLRDFTGRFYAIEAKSISSRCAPMWNDNLPKAEAIYILSSRCENATTVFLGKDVIDQALCDLQKQMLEKLYQVHREFKSKIAAADKYNRGWDCKFRPQNFQHGGKEKTNYFTHSSRTACEQNVLSYVSV